MRYVAILLAGLVSAGATANGGQVYRLGEGGGLEQVGQSRQEQYLLRVAEVKRLVNEGNVKAAKEAAEQLKKGWPEIAGEDFDAYMEAELLLCKGKPTKAAKRYDKLLDDYPASGLRDAAMERLFEIGTDFLAGRKRRVLKVFKVRGYAEGVRVMEKISDRAGSAQIGQRAALAVVRYYERRGKWDEAYLKWSEISSRWPVGELGRESLLGMARAKYAGYKGPRYDASSLISAKSYYENFRLRYADEAGKIGADEILSKIYEQLAEKELDTARYYSRTGGREGANLYYQMVIDKWPGSKAASAAAEEMGRQPVRKKGKSWLKKLEELVL